MKQFSSLIIRLQDVHEAVCGLKYINSAIHPPTQCSTVESCHSGKLIVSQVLQQFPFTMHACVNSGQCQMAICRQ